MSLKPYHQFKTFKVIVATLILIIAIFNFLKIEEDNKYVYLIKFIEKKDEILISKANNGNYELNDNFLKIKDKKYKNLIYYNNLKSNTYNINLINNKFEIKYITPKYSDTYYNPYQNREKRFESLFDRELTKEELDRIYPRDKFSSLIKFESNEIVDQKILQSPKLEFFVEMQSQYFSNRLILLIILMFILLFYIFLVIRK